MRKVREPRQLGATDVSRQTHRLSCLEHLLHAQCGPHLHACVRHLRAWITEPVRCSHRYANRLAGIGHNGSASESPNAESHLAGDDGKLLLLDGMDVSSRNVRAGGQIEIEHEQLAAGLCATHANDNALTTDWIYDDTLVWRETRRTSDT